MRWDEVDFERQCLNLSDSKTGKRTVMLNSAALEILEGLEQVEGNPYVIPGGKRGKPLSTLQRLWDRVRVVADIADVQVQHIGGESRRLASLARPRSVNGPSPMATPMAGRDCCGDARC